MGRVLFAGLALLLAAPAAAQQNGYVRQQSPAWLGVSYELRWVQGGGSCTPRVVVDAVVQGSPAERAGLRAGDAIIALDGEPLPPGRLQAVASRLEPGDSVRLRLLRDGRRHEVTAIADRRPDRPVSFLLPRSTGLRSSTAPIIEITGDTLVAWNLSPGLEQGRIRSYWVSGADGRTEYRRLGGWSRSDLDRRVEDLLSCADSAQWTNDAWYVAAQNVDLRRVQERADSLRVLMTRRALERTAESAAAVPSPPSRPEPSTIQVYGPEGSYMFRVDEHVAVGMRGVAGAELTALEPELAEYFRNVDEGLLVIRIAPDTPADRAGIRPGDVIVGADGRGIESVAELRRVVALPYAGAVRLRVVRRGRTLDLTLERD